MSIRIICYFSLFFFAISTSEAQDTAGRYRLVRAEALADSVISKLETAKNPDVLKPFFPPLNLFMQTADSVKSGQNTQMLQARYQASYF